MLKIPKKNVVDKIVKTCNNGMNLLKYDNTSTASNQSLKMLQL